MPQTRRFLTALSGGAAILACLSLAAAPAGALIPPDGAESAPSASHDRTSSSHRTVTYQGYQVRVPAAWPVIDLEQNPRACVRFDRPAVYVGPPGDQATCPTDLIGRTTALLIQPLTEQAVAAAPHAATSVNAPSVDASIQVAVEKAGVLVTAAHGPDSEHVVRDILRTAEVVEERSGDRPSLDALRDKTRQRQSAVLPAAVDPQPGTFTGLGFDQCAAPSQSAMNAWRSSPYQVVGIYISGPQRACAQPNLTASWVANQAANGWRMIPIEVGPQAPCTSYANRMSSDPATARSQGSQRATASAQAAEALGIPPGSVLYNDIENYPRGGSCTAAVLSFISGWTDTLHDLGYLSGMYSSAGSGMRDLVDAVGNSQYSLPDHIWFAWWNGKADADGGTYIPDHLWANGQRIHQYRGDHNETHGGVTINIDSNYLDVRAGTPEPPSECRTVSLDFTAYDVLRSGASGNQVEAAQCLLKARGLYEPEPPTGTYDATTVEAVRAFQTERRLTVTGELDAKSWTALLSQGSTPTIRQGASGEAVRRLQRALTAALGRTVGIDGQFGPLTDAAVREYQDTRQLDVDGIVGPDTWGALQAGK
ncbi:MAG TPA: glycoside hydrolase domain-containing protein [Actinopolymorphaceae bacterium]